MGAAKPSFCSPSALKLNSFEFKSYVVSHDQGIIKYKYGIFLTCPLLCGNVKKKKKKKKSINADPYNDTII
jgi:hypothetical protein